MNTTIYRWVVCSVEAEMFFAFHRLSGRRRSGSLANMEQDMVPLFVKWWRRSRSANTQSTHASSVARYVRDYHGSIWLSEVFYVLSDSLVLECVWCITCVVLWLKVCISLYFSGHAKANLRWDLEVQGLPQIHCRRCLLCEVSWQTVCAHSVKIVHSVHTAQVVNLWKGSNYGIWC